MSSDGLAGNTGVRASSTLQNLPKPDNLDQLIKESEQALQRLQRLESINSAPLGKRVGRHLSRNSNSFIHIILAGCIFAVAASRLNDKKSHEAAEYELEKKIRALSMENRVMQGQIDAAETLAAKVEESVKSSGGRLMTPQLKEALEGFKAAGIVLPLAATSTQRDSK